MMSFVTQRMPCTIRNRISTVSAFSCGQVKTIRIRYVWTPFFFKTEEKISVFKNNWIRVDEAKHSRGPVYKEGG